MPGHKLSGKKKVPIYLNGEGYITGMHAADIGNAAQKLGAGRAEKTDIIDPGLHIRFDRYLWLKADDSLSCQKRIMHILHIRICIFRERFPTVILINGHGIPAQVE